MTNVAIKEDLYKQIKKYIKKQKITHPSITQYVNWAVQNQLRIDLINQLHAKAKK